MQHFIALSLRILIKLLLTSSQGSFNISSNEIILGYRFRC